MTRLCCVGVVIEEFDTTFVNKYYNSQYDDRSNVDTTAIVAAASLVARTLTMLASDDVSTVDSPALNSIQVFPCCLSVRELPLWSLLICISTVVNRCVLDSLIQYYLFVLLSLLCIAFTNR